MALNPFPLAISYGKTEAVKNSGGYLVNMLAKAAPQDAKTPVTLVGAPGLKEFADLGNAPIINMLEINGRLYAVTFDSLYRVYPDGGMYRLGELTLRPTCSLATNAVHIVVTDGNRIFAYEMRDDEDDLYQGNVPYTNYVVELTGQPNYYPAFTATTLDQMIVFPRNGTRQVYNTDLLSLDVNPLAFTAKESRPDNVMAVAENLQQLYVIGNRTFEVWYNSGAGESPFVRVDGVRGDHGTTSPYTVKSFRNSMIWLDQNGVVILVQGYQPRPISTVAIEDELSGRDYTFATAFCYSEDGHDFYVLTVEDVTFAYDLSTGLWHRRKSLKHGRHVGSCHAYAYGKNLVGSFADGKIYEMRSDIYDDAGVPLVAENVPPPLDVAFQMASHHTIELDIDVGEATLVYESVPLTADWTTSSDFVITTDTGEPIEFYYIPGIEVQPAMIGMEISNDEGRTWGFQRMTSLGNVGEYKARARWRRNGQSRQRRYRFQISDPIPRRMTSRAWIETS